MKTLFVVDERKMGGVSVILENIFNELKDYQFDLLVLHNNGDRLENLKNVNTIYGSSIFEACDMRIKDVLKTKKISLLLKKMYLVFAMKTGLIKKIIKKERKKILKEKYDIEISFKDGIGTYFVAYGDSNKKIRWMHTDYSNNDPGNKYPKTYYDALKQYDDIVAISKSVEEKFNNKYHMENKTRVIYNLMNIKEIKNKPKKEPYDLELVAVGRLNKVKGYDRVIKAISKLNKEKLFENKIFKIVGDGPMKAELLQLIKEEKLNDKVKLLGSSFKPWELIPNGDLFIMSSLTEAYPTTIIESLSNHIPVLSVEYSSVYEMLDEKNSIIIPNVDEEIYNALKSIILNQEQLKKLQKNVLDYKYDNEKIVKQLKEILEVK